MKENYKACEEIIFEEDMDLVSMLSDTKVLLPKGSKGIVTLKGNVVIKSGELYGKILPQSMFEWSVKGIDTDNLSAMILSRLKYKLPDFKDYMEGYELEDSDITDEIWEVLSDYL